MFGVLSHLVMSDFLRPHGLQPVRLLCPWGFSMQEYWSGLPHAPPDIATYTSYINKIQIKYTYIHMHVIS